MTDKYAVIGNPIAHSKSPQIHMMFAEQTGQDINYETILAPLDGFAATIEQLRDKGYKGCSVTVPFKFKSFELATELSMRARSAQAVNTLTFEGDSTNGDNTDGAGLVRDIEQNLGILLKGKRVLLMGAGGAAYGVAQPIFKACSHLSVTNRTIEKAQRMVESFDEEHVISIFEYSSLKNESFDVVINATSSGLFDEMPPLPTTVFSPGALAYDMMYGRETPFMKFAREHGAQVADGLGMLVEQAAEAFNIWREVRPNTSPVITALRSL
ncbi:MAG: shikimate dehydrogenase [Gallionella sp.]